MVLTDVPNLTRYYYQFALAHALHPWGPNGGWTAENQGAECLYMILSRIQVGDSSALSFISDRQIGDTDQMVPSGVGDGMPEILDAWGNPIRFVRWPVGFASDFVDQNSLDAFDPSRAFQGVANAGNGGISFQSVPLMVSPGPDGLLDLALSPGPGSPTSRVFYGRYPVPNDPYVALPPAGLFIGAVDDNEDPGTNNAIDNIHSHLIKTSVK